MASCDFGAEFLAAEVGTPHVLPCIWKGTSDQAPRFIVARSCFQWGAASRWKCSPSLPLATGLFEEAVLEAATALKVARRTSVIASALEMLLSPPLLRSDGFVRLRRRVPAA